MTEKDILAVLEEPEGLEKAFNGIVDAYQERLYWHIRRFVFDHDDANDVIQNTFIKIWKNLKNFRGDAKLYTWLYRIATNESITFLNKKKKIVADELGLESATAASLQADVYFDGDKIQAKLFAAIEKLPEKQKAIFHLRYFEEMKYAQMSEVLETSEGALKAGYHHAVKKIEQYLKSD